MEKRRGLSPYSNTRWMVEAGIMVALAQALSYVKVMEMPAGGSVTAGSMVPILIFAARWGVKKGFLAGVTYGILQFLLGEKYSFHPVSLLCDYVLAFGLLGLAGLSTGSFAKTILGTILGVCGRFICHVISGVIVFASYAPEGTTPLMHSIIYNGSYLLPELIISVVMVALLYNALKRYQPQN